MNNEEISRRQLLRGAGALSGTLLLTRVVLAADEDDKTKANQGTTTKIEDGQIVLRLNDNPELGTLGGWKLFDLGDDKIIIAHTDKGLIARSAICPHRGCPVNYNLEAHQFVCPCHNSRFDEDGKVVRGPAKTDLQKYAADQALVVAKA